MSNINVTVFTGNLTRDPDCHYNGQTCERANFCVAVNAVWYKDKEKKQKTSFIDCVAYGQPAQFIGAYAKKGTSVAIEGALDQQRWETQDGEKRSRLVVKVKSIQLTDKPSETAPGHQGHYKEPAYGQGEQRQMIDPNDEDPF